MPRNSSRTSFNKMQKTQKISRKDALAIRACHKELPHMQGFNTILGQVYGIKPDTVGKILRNELHCD